MSASEAQRRSRLGEAFGRGGVLVLLLASLVPARAAAEVPPVQDRHGREFRVDFSAQHLEVDADLGELSLSGDVVVTVGRYRLAGQKVRLQRGPRGIKVEGSGEIAFCSCEQPPLRVGYSSVTLAPPSDVVLQGAVLRAGAVPLLWLPYLWLRSPDRLGVIFPSAEWRGEDGLLLGSGIHVPFDSNEGRPSARALDVGLFGYTRGGARIDAQLFTPQSTTRARWDYVDGAALELDAHGATQGEAGELGAFDFDVSRGARGRRMQSELTTAAQRYDRARAGVGSTGVVLFALGAEADAARAERLADPGTLGPFALLSTGGRLGASSSYALDLGAGTRVTPERSRSAQQRALQRATLETSLLAGPLLARLAGFEQASLLSTSDRADASLDFGAGAQLALPLLRRFAGADHLLSPSASARLARHQRDGAAATELVALLGLENALGVGGARRLAVGSLALDAGFSASELTLGTQAALDARLLGAHVSGALEPAAAAEQVLARVRFGPRGGTHVIGYAEGSSDPGTTLQLPRSGALAPGWFDGPAFDRAGWTTGAELHVLLWSELALSGGADLDWQKSQPGFLAARSGAAYRHRCGCFAISALASRRVGRGGFDAALTLDLMP